MKTTLTLLILLLVPAFVGCGSDAPPAITSENNGVKPVPDYQAMIDSEVAAREAKKADQNGSQ